MALGLRLAAEVSRQLRVLLLLVGTSLPAMADSSLVWAVPFALDAILIVLAAKYREVFWLFPPIVTAASLFGVALIYWVGRSAGDGALTRLVSARHLERAKLCLDQAGVVTIAAAAVLPPPFPLTPFVLTCGALDINRRRFFLVFGVMRLFRFGSVALLARQYGETVLKSLESRDVQIGLTMLAAMALAAMAATGIVLWRRVTSLQMAGEPVGRVEDELEMLPRQQRAHA